MKFRNQLEFCLISLLQKPLKLKRVIVALWRMHWDTGEDEDEDRDGDGEGAGEGVGVSNKVDSTVQCFV